MQTIKKVAKKNSTDYKKCLKLCDCKQNKAFIFAIYRNKIFQKLFKALT